MKKPKKIITGTLVVATGTVLLGVNNASADGVNTDLPTNEPQVEVTATPSVSKDVTPTVTDKTDTVADSNPEETSVTSTVTNNPSATPQENVNAIVVDSESTVATVPSTETPDKVGVAEIPGNYLTYDENNKAAYVKGKIYSYDNMDAVKNSPSAKDDKVQVVSDYGHLTLDESMELTNFAADLLNPVRQSVWSKNGVSNDAWKFNVVPKSVDLARRVAGEYNKDNFSIITNNNHDYNALTRAYLSYGIGGYQENYGSSSINNYAARKTGSYQTTMYQLKKAVFDVIITMLYNDDTLQNGGASVMATNDSHSNSLLYGTEDPKKYGLQPNYLGVAVDSLGQVHIINLPLQYVSLNNSQFLENRANIDDIRMSGTDLVVRGWHAADMSYFQKNAYVILYDTTANSELGRVAYVPDSSNDVARVYPTIYGVEQSRFNVAFSLAGKDFAGHQLKFVLRYSDQKNGEGVYTDWWSDPYVFNANVGVVDAAYIQGSKLKISGWHAADASAVKPYRYVVLYDASAGRELARKRIQAVERKDVQNAYPRVYDAVKSGFAVEFDLSQIKKYVAGHQLQYVLRYASKENGEGNKTDVWSGKYSYKNEEYYIDSVGKTGSKLHVTGWHVADTSVNQKYAYVILFDQTKGSELTRIKVGDSSDSATSTLVARPDVVSAKKIYTDGKNGFDVYFDLAKLSNYSAGDRLQFVLRYSSDATGGEGSRIDAWTGAYTVYGTQNASNLDQVKISNDGLSVSGWHIADQSINQPYAWAILYDASTNQEVQRVTYKSTKRPDVKRAYPGAYNAENSGFSNVMFDKINIAKLKGHNLQVVLRYSNDLINGEGNRTDSWSKIFRI
ncbi:SEC10/PgrA surface exclusion domain-containing protein [Ligilactobacillus equi]|uniref:Uncharacterized protein n=1 Tax=Ligilactobacillus equi DSM 15833 = JCM 10991 TaxID=1423740 RepID=A0A0R1TD75_9LACO|nr:SEC10/PgrA surface exclusion domain-containing protein [Ligilactobacillus equi]KRL79327.1 hypothetical protein FC36_GL000812 [Ligilactobacillus equi DSM 15833 = JCM 10991]